MNTFEAGADHSGFVDLPTPSGQVVRHLEVCGKKMPFTISIKSAREIAQRLVDEYGQRALQAEQNHGIDWKALSHAVRAGREALELFSTGRKAIGDARARLIFLPPYSPDLNRIAQVFAKLKTLLRRSAARTIEDRWKGIGTLLSALSLN